MAFGMPFCLFIRRARLGAGWIGGGSGSPGLAPTCFSSILLFFLFIIFFSDGLASMTRFLLNVPDHTQSVGMK